MGVRALLPMELILRCREGDAAAFTQLVQSTQSRTYGLAWRLAGNRTDALDLVQEGYVAVWRALPSLRNPELFTPWFLRVFTNACRNWLRRARRTPLPIEITPTLLGAEPSESPAEALVQREAQESLHALVRNLPPIYAVTITLHYAEGLGYQQLAEVLDLPVRTVETRLRRARQMLRRQLEQAGIREGGDRRARESMQASARVSE